MHVTCLSLDESLQTRGRALERLARHRQDGMDLLAAWRGAAGRRRSLLLRRLLLGLGLQWKAEQLLLLPALLEARPDLSVLIHSVRDELDVLRDLSMLAGRTAAADRQMVMGMLEGLSQLHNANVDRLCTREGQSGSDVDWLEIDAGIEALLRPWGDIAGVHEASSSKTPNGDEDSEVAEGGDAEPSDEEDEDADPVGEPPR